MPLHRRALLGAVLAAPALHLARAEGADYDALVVGAGAAGIAAARDLMAGGARTVVVEARDRLGGRAHTDASLGPAFDAGASYLHWAERNPWVAIAAELGVRLTDEDWGGGFEVYDRGRPLPAADRLARRAGFGRLSGIIDDEPPAGQDFPLARRATTPDEAVLLRSLAHLSMGEEPERFSARDYAGLWAGDDYEVPSGFGALVARHGEGLPVRLATPVTRLDWGGAGVSAETPGGTLRAKIAVVTVPVGVLKSEAIAFAPALPPETARALDGLFMGALTKVAVSADVKRLGFRPSTTLFDVSDPARPFNLDVAPFGRNLVVAYLGGDHAREVVAMGEAGAGAYVAGKLGGMLGAKAREALGAPRLAGWWSDPFSRGSYSLAVPGRADARAALARPVGGRLWFAGEATAGPGADTVGGATLAGRAAAREALGVLRG